MLTIEERLQALLDRGMVKSVQRGTNAGAANANDINITISSVVPSKCLVFLNGHRGTTAGATGPFTSLPYVKSLTATSLIIGNSGEPPNTANSFSYQVIEYY